MPADVISLGCRLNIAEGETIRGLLGERDTVVVNSCAVTDGAVKDTRKAIRRMRAAHPDAELVVTGCAAQLDPAAFAAMPEVSRVIGNADKLVPAAWDAPERVRVSDFARIAALAPHLAVAADGSRAFVEVQNGCDHRCTFCAIAPARGPSRSAPVSAVVERIAALVAGGKREVVLTGVDLTSYGADLPGAPTLGLLVEAILAGTPVERLRLSSLDAPEIDERLFALIAGEARVMPHLHLSLQAGDDLILRRMKRRHARADAVRLVARLKAARDVAIGADLIAGFPTEDEAAFANTRALIADCAIVHAHIFPFSARAGTPAARMPQVAPELRRARAAELRAAAAEAQARWLAGLVGSRQAVLVERPGDRGHAGNFAEVRLGRGPVPAGPAEALPFSSGDPAQKKYRTSTRSARTVEIGDIVAVFVTSVESGKLIGTPA